ncbi:MAG: phosphoglycerate dehydrogenase [bacterium]|nr:phosphoglycerate dehydrogenase [bacterium]
MVTTNCFERAESPINIAIHEEIKAYAAHRGIEFHYKYLRDFSTENQIREMKDFDGVIIGSEPFNAEIMEGLQDRLKAVIRFGVGYDAVDLDAATRSGIPVANTPGTNSVSVAEHALTLMLALQKKVVENCSNLRKGEWVEPIGKELSAKTVALLGFGKIARILAGFLKGFSCRVIAYDVCFNGEKAQELGVEYCEIAPLFSEADVISLHIPFTPETNKIVGKEFLGKMKNSAFLINTSRGGVVDEEALISVLQENRIAGAGLDVFSEEPIAPDHPFTKLENVVMTPHVAASTYESSVRTYRMAIDSVLDFMKGKTRDNLLNPDYVKHR